MALQYKFIERPTDAEACIKLMESTVIPLLSEHWERDGKPFFHRDFYLNLEGFFNYWMYNGLAMVIAYDEGKPVGILIGLRFVPMNFRASILQIENLYGKTPEVEEGLYNYIQSISNILDFDELWVATDTIKRNPTHMRMIGESKIIRYAKE